LGGAQETSSKKEASVARERTADDQVLALLAQTSLPLERAQIASSLGWEKSMVGKVLLRLVQQDRLDVTQGEANGASGRPSAKFALKSSSPQPAGHPTPALKFETDTFVVTPADREARVVLHRCDGFVEIEYLDGPRSDARGYIRADYLRPFQPGRARPAPYRAPS
jgi:hypothetical protein